MENQPSKPPAWKEFGYAVLGNVVLLIVYTALFKVTKMGGEGAYPFNVFITSCVQAVVCLFISIGCFIGKRTDLGAGFLLSAFVVPLIGFSVCLAGFDMSMH